MQSAPATSHDHRTPSRLRGRGGGEHVPVQVGIVVQDGQNGRASGADAKLVVDGLGRSIFLALLRVGHLVGELRAILLFLALFELILDLIPVVHQDHVRVGQPHVPLGDVVEDDGLAIGAEDNLTGGDERIDDHLLVRGRILARAHIRPRSAPRTVGTSFMPHGRRRDAGRGPLGGGRDHGLPTRQRNRYKRGGGGHQDRVILRSGLLQDGIGLYTGRAEVEGLIPGQKEGVRGRVKGDNLIADDRDGKAGTIGNPGDLSGLRLID